MKLTSLGFRTDLMLRRLGGSAISDRGDHLVVRTPANPGYYWGNFVLAVADLAAADRWTAAFAAEFPDAQHVAIGLDTTVVDDSLLAGYLAAGLTPELSTVLTAAGLASAPVPMGATLRPLSGDDDWHQALELRYALDDDHSPAHRLFGQRKVAELRRVVEAGSGVWLGAFLDGTLRAELGVFSDGSGPARYQDVDTHPEYRRRGLARALISAAGAYAVEQLGAAQLVIVADPAYHAIELYRSLGFLGIETQVQLQRPAS